MGRTAKNASNGGNADDKLQNRLDICSTDEEYVWFATTIADHMEISHVYNSMVHLTERDEAREDLLDGHSLTVTINVTAIYADDESMLYPRCDTEGEEVVPHRRVPEDHPAATIEDPSDLEEYATDRDEYLRLWEMSAGDHTIDNVNGDVNLWIGSEKPFVSVPGFLESVSVDGDTVYQRDT